MFCASWAYSLVVNVLVVQCFGEVLRIWFFEGGVFVGFGEEVSGGCWWGF